MAEMAYRCQEAFQPEAMILVKQPLKERPGEGHMEV